MKKSPIQWCGNQMARADHANPTARRQTVYILLLLLLRRALHFHLATIPAMCGWKQTYRRRMTEPYNKRSTYPRAAKARRIAEASKGLYATLTTIMSEQRQDRAVDVRQMT